MAKVPTRTGLIPQNPLAVIALLIGVVEAALSYPVTMLSGTNQTIFVWFMVGFPSLLMLGFYLTVWFRPGHLYSPKDYAKDETFLEGIGKLAPKSIERTSGQQIGQPAPARTIGSPPGLRSQGS